MGFISWIQKSPSFGWRRNAFISQRIWETFALQYGMCLVESMPMSLLLRMIDDEMMLYMWKKFDKKLFVEVWNTCVQPKIFRRNFNIHRSGILLRQRFVMKNKKHRALHRSFLRTWELLELVKCSAVMNHHLRWTILSINMGIERAVRRLKKNIKILNFLVWQLWLDRTRLSVYVKILHLILINQMCI